MEVMDNGQDLFHDLLGKSFIFTKKYYLTLSTYGCWYYFEFQDKLQVRTVVRSNEVDKCRHRGGRGVSETGMATNAKTRLFKMGSLQTVLRLLH